MVVQRDVMTSIYDSVVSPSSVILEVGPVNTEVRVWVTLDQEDFPPKPVCPTS